MKAFVAASALALTLAACSQAPAPTAGDSQSDATATPSPTIASASPVAPSPAPVASAPVLGLAGLGDLKIGQAVPTESGWAERGAQASDACRTITSPAVAGVYAIVEGGTVRRISLGRRSTVKLAEGIGVGATEAQVTAAFAGFRAEPHKYVDPPAKYLTAPNAASGDPALRFEIDAEEKVSAIHVGTEPQLLYIEGCS